MNADYEATCNSLDALGAAIKAAWGDDRTFAEVWGWNCPAITRHDAAAFATKLSSDIRESAHESADDAVTKYLKDLPRRLQLLQASTVPQFFGGNSGIAMSVYICALGSIRNMLIPQLAWTTISEQKLMPVTIARRLRAIQAEIEQITPNKEALTAQISTIQSAHDAAESLPLDMASLLEARNKLEKSSTESTIAAAKVAQNAKDSDADIAKIRALNTQAEQLVSQCEEAYRITTTKGLAGAFDQRAARLSRSMWVWVSGLVCALVAGSAIGAYRVSQLSLAIQGPDLRWGLVLVHFVLAVVSVGAPVWFAWIATKQIGQRFRLAEDYAFKASVAKAYEGYRKEAARIDDAFEARLFNSALERLEEAPLRLVEPDTHGSPWQEFFASPSFKKALETVPELQSSFADALTKVVRTFGRTKAGPKVAKE